MPKRLMKRKKKSQQSLNKRENNRNKFKINFSQTFIDLDLEKKKSIEFGRNFFFFDPRRHRN